MPKDTGIKLDNAGPMTRSEYDKLRGAEIPADGNPCIKGVDIGEAIRWVKNGGKFIRKGWNSDKQYVYYVPAAAYPAHRNVNGTMVGEYENDMIEYNHYLAIKTPDGTVSTWAPSCADALATDFILIQ